MIDRFADLAGLVRDDAEHVHGFGVVRLGAGCAPRQIVGVGEETVAALLFGENERMAGRQDLLRGEVRQCGLRGFRGHDRRGLRGLAFARGLERHQRRRVALRNHFELLRHARNDVGHVLAALFWRNSRIVGYQGLSSRPSSQRQSVTHGSGTQTGLPSAPARCATDVSTVITRSSALDGARGFDVIAEFGRQIVDRMLGFALSSAFSDRRRAARIAGWQTKRRARQRAAQASAAKPSGG